MKTLDRPVKDRGLRIEFEENGERVYDILGPFDSREAEYLLLQYGEHGWNGIKRGLGYVLILSAQIVPYED
jgi:hypothetical protein